MGFKPLCDAVGFLCSLLPVFGVRVLVAFHLMCVYNILVRFQLLSGQHLGNSCSLS